jgi:hypothetical protein
MRTRLYPKCWHLEEQLKELFLTLAIVLLSFSEIHAARYWADPEGSNTVPCLNIRD